MQMSTVLQPPAEKGEDKQQEDINKMDDNFYYADDHLEQVFEDSSITRNTMKFYDIFGFDSYKRYNLHILSDREIIYIAGITFQIFDIISNTKRIFFSKDQGGIGSISVHPSKKWFSVGEKGNSPNVYIYEYPSLKLYRILRKGTEKSYSNITFSPSGKLIATVGSYPDYLLSIWDWKNEILLLKSKAFSQEIYKIGFSEYAEDVLYSSGMGHLKFWKIAETFTGLKLKDSIAKFGQVELSDVTAFFGFPDGKVLSGTEYGKLLLWDGNLIKCTLQISQDENCHSNNIEVIFKDQQYLVTAGGDGRIKFWDYNQIDQAEGDDYNNFYIQPVKQYTMYTSTDVPSKILWIERDKDFWVFTDSNGKIFKINLDTFNQELIMETNSGKITDLAISQNCNAAAIVSEDASVRILDIVNKKQYLHRQFYAEGTCLTWVPFNMRNQGRELAVGFSNGIVRFILINPMGLFLVKSFKVHRKGITHISFSCDGINAAIVSQEGHIFLMELSAGSLSTIEPYCLFETDFQISSICWDKMSEKLLIGCKDGFIHEITVPKKEYCDSKQSYLKDYQYRSYRIKMMEFQKPKKDEMDIEFLLKKKQLDEKEEEWDPAGILCVIYYDNECTQILASVEGRYLGYLYVINWKEERPVESIKIPKIPASIIKFQENNEILLVGYENGGYTIHHQHDTEKYIRMYVHDKDYGRIRNLGLSYQGNIMISASEDGTLMAYNIDRQGANRLFKEEELPEDYEFEWKDEIGLGEGAFQQELDLGGMKEEEKDILDDSIYSLQEKKVLEEQDQKKKIAEEKKSNMRKAIKELQEEYEKIVQMNSQTDQISQLTNQDMTIDPQYNEILEKRLNFEIEEVKKELEWNTAYALMKCQKLMDYMMHELEVDRFHVRALRNPNIFIQTFKVKKMAQYLREQLDKIYEEIEEESKQQQDMQNEQMEDNTNKKDLSPMGQQSQGNQQQEQENGQQQQQQFDDGMGKEDEKIDLKKKHKIEQEKFKKEQERIAKQILELEQQAPRESNLESEYIPEIEEASRNLGDYKLKSDKNYEVPENQRMNVSKQRKHMFLLEEFIYNTKMKFNNDIIQLKEKKKCLIEKIQRYNSRISEINKQLGIQEELFLPKFDNDTENPETLFDVKEEEINQEYERQKQLAQKKKPNQQQDEDEQQQQQQQQAQQQEQQNQQQQTEKSQQQIQQEKGQKRIQIKYRKERKIQQSELEDEWKETQQIILNAEKKKLLDELNEEIDQFDKEIMDEKNEKNLMESDMKVAEMKLNTKYQELLILDTMEDHDVKLIQSLKAFNKEMEAITEKMNCIKEQLAEILNQDAALEKKKQDLYKTFNETVFKGDEPKREKVHEFYAKKMKNKRTKLKQDEEGDEEEQSQESEEIESESGDEDDEEKNLIALIEQNPEEKALITEIVTIEDNLETNKKMVNDFKKQEAQFKIKMQEVGQQKSQVEQEIKNHQKEKLSYVNKLYVSAFLKLSQIQNLTKGNNNNYMTPEDLTYSILFTEGDLTRLGQRIKELEKEQKQNDNQTNIFKRKKALLDKENKKKLMEIKKMNDEYEEKHRLKFGVLIFFLFYIHKKNLIDLQLLEALEPTKVVLEKRKEFEEKEKESIKKIEDATNKLMEAKKKLLEAKRENTTIINNICWLGGQQAKLNKALESTNKQLFKEDNEEKKDDLEREKQNLKELVKFLSKEISDLKTEIGVFKRKGGHIYTMVTTNKKNVAYSEINKNLF